MKYQINQLVLTNNNKIKKINEIELIEGVWIFYMTDGTSYSESQISEKVNVTSILNKKVELNSEKLIEKLCDIKVFISGFNKIMNIS